MNKKPLSILATVIVAFALGACSSSVKLDEPAPVEDRSGAASNQAGSTGSGSRPAGMSERPVAQVTIEPSKDPYSDPSSPLYKRSGSIYFDFDSFTVREEFRPTVEAHATFLVTNKTRKVVVQGNTDDRGSREYNLALGQKRAEAVRRSLVALGVADAQVEAVSFGEEKPRAAGTDEASWAENRRADLAYQ